MPWSTELVQLMPATAAQYGVDDPFDPDQSLRAGGELIRDLLGDNFHAQERRAYIYHRAHDLYTQFPFQAHLFGLPIPIVRECLVGLTRAVESQARGEFDPQKRRAAYQRLMQLALETTPAVPLFDHAVAYAITGSHWSGYHFFKKALINAKQGRAA